MKISKFLICVDNSDYPASLERWKIYPVVGERDAEGLIRIVDESGEDYLYPQELFTPIQLPSIARERFQKEYNEESYQ